MIGSHRLSKNISNAKYKQPNSSKRSLHNQKYASWQLFAQHSGDILFATWVGLICAVPPCYMQTDFQLPAEAAELKLAQAVVPLSPRATNPLNLDITDDLLESDRQIY